MPYDICIAGGGLVGLATARALLTARPGLSLVLFEKEDELARHQSGHNSGVIHSGLYYRPGSLKAELAVSGARALYQLCAEAGIAHRRSGKLVVATERAQLSALEELERRGKANGLEGLERLDPAGIRELEPEAAGIGALRVPAAGVVDFRGVARFLAEDLRRRGAEIRLGEPVTRIILGNGGLEVVAGEALSSRYLINCAGLHSDRVARLAGIEPSIRIVPFRGEYYTLGPQHLVRGLIYPVPDPRFPFLGVHFTRRIDDSVEVGPNALVALGREQYRGCGFAWADVAEMLRYPGFRKLAKRNLLPGARELLNSRSRALYARLARRLIPAVRADDLVKGGAGIRAQAVDPRGNLVDDFVIEADGHGVHVLNAPSPGATACLAIGKHIARQVERFYPGWGPTSV